MKNDRVLAIVMPEHARKRHRHIPIDKEMHQAARPMEY